MAAAAAAAARGTPEEFGKGHGRSSTVMVATPPSSPPAPCGVSVELAIDKLAAALNAQTAPAALIASPLVSAGVGRRTARGDKSGAVMPWWRQLPGRWPLVWVSASPATADGTKQGMLGVADEVFRIVRGLWRLGGRCEVQPLDAGPPEAAPWQHCVGPAHLGICPPDFAVLLRFRGTSDVTGGKELTAPRERREPSPGPTASQGGNQTAGQRRLGQGRTTPMAAAARSASPNTSAAPCALDLAELDCPLFTYEVRAVSDQGMEVMDRATKDHGLREGGRDFDDCRRLFEFFDKLFRRLPIRHSGHGFPRGALDALVEQSVDWRW